MSCVWMLQRGHSGDGCVLALTLCKYDLRKGDLFVLSWARVRRVRRGNISSELLVCGGGVRSILLLPLVARTRTFGCVAMGSALLFIVRSRLLVYSAGSGVNRVQVVLSGFSRRLFCFVQAKTLYRYGCMYFLAALVLVCVDVIVMSSV